MPAVVAIENLKPDQAKRMELVNGVETPIPGNITFFRQSAANPMAPSVTLNFNDIPGRWQSAHFHDVDQFQIIVRGKGKLGRHEVTPYSVHFARAYTAYGPLQSDKDSGWAILSFRARYNAGQKLLPKYQEELKQTPNHHPWQIIKKISFPAQGSGATLQDVPEIKDDQGLFVNALTMAPHSRTVAPAPSGGDGQFVAVFKGSLMHDGQEHKALSVAFIKPVDGAFEIVAGPQGLEGLILNFPKVAPRVADVRSPSAAHGLKKWQCALCAFAYDEAVGMPEDGIPAGTRWQDVPETWSCPDCSASKSDFLMA